MTDDFHEKLRKLARLSVRFGLNLQPGQELFLTADIEALPLVRLITEEAYKAGATGVIPLFADDAMTLAKFQHGSDAAIDAAPGWLYQALGDALSTGRVARLAISGDTPGLLSAQDPDRVGRANAARAIAARPFLDAITSDRTNWNIVPYVTPGWAAQVFPQETPAAAQARLWDLVFHAVRIDRPDPVAAWQENFAELKRRQAVLNDLAFDALQFQGGGTDLTLGLASGHRWIGGGLAQGSRPAYAPNLPTEEVFTMPDRARAEGKAVFSKPAVIAGTIVEGLTVEFSGGKAVRVAASTGQSVIEKHLATDDGAAHLGEVALVAASSPIAQAGTLFFNTLFDENAACHIAFGNAYSMNLKPGTDAAAAGMNTSQIHSDCMIGHDAINVTGIHRDGSRVAIMAAGEFVI